MRNRHILGWGLFAGMALIFSGNYIASCTRENQVEEHVEAKAHTLNVDSLKTAFYQAKIAYQDSIMLVQEQRDRETRAVYRALASRDVVIENEYRAAPTLAGADTVIASKNRLIGNLKETVTTLDTALVASKAKSAALSDLVASKDTTIKKMDAGWQRTILALQKAKKPKRWGFGFNLGSGVNNKLQVNTQIQGGISFDLFSW